LVSKAPPAVARILRDGRGGVTFDQVKTASSRLDSRWNGKSLHRQTSSTTEHLTQTRLSLTLNQRVDGSSPSGSTLLLPVRNLASPARGRLVWRCRRLTGASFAALVRESDLPQPDSTLVLCF